MLVTTSTGLFKLSRPIDGQVPWISDAAGLDDFVRLVDSMGPQKIRRITKNDAAFARQLRGRAKTSPTD
jgi:hypothetical protein